MARSSTSTRSSSGRPAPASTSPPRITPGSVGPTKTPTAWCDSTCPSARAWPTSPSTIAIGSRRNSTAGRGSDSAIGLRRNAMPDETQCCTSKLISDSSFIRSAPCRVHLFGPETQSLEFLGDHTVRGAGKIVRQCYDLGDSVAERGAEIRDLSVKHERKECMVGELIVDVSGLSELLAAKT